VTASTPRHHSRLPSNGPRILFNATTLPPIQPPPGLLRSCLAPEAPWLPRRQSNPRRNAAAPINRQLPLRSCLTPRQPAPAGTPPADAATSIPLRLRCASTLRPASGYDAHRRGSTPSARLRRIPLRRAPPPLNRAPGDSPDPPEGISASRRPTGTRSTATPLHRGVTDCYATVAIEAPATLAKPPRYVPCAESSTPPGRLRYGQRLRSCLSPAIPSAPAPPSGLRSHTATVTTRMPAPCRIPALRRTLNARGGMGPTGYTHNLALCRILRRIPISMST